MMVDGTDLEAAVRAGVVPGHVADQLRNFAAERRGSPAAGEERFGLAGGLSDIMTAIGTFLLLGAAIAFLGAIPFAPAILAPVAWALAEHFTRRRRLILTSMVLFAVFALAICLALLPVAMMLAEPPGSMSLDHGLRTPAVLSPLQSLVVAAGAAGSCAAWWFRFRLPVAVAACVMALVNILTHVMRMAIPDAPAGFVSVHLLLVGIFIFLAAMWWDMSDIRRETRRSDVAFWLHAMAGYQIAGASFRLIFGVAGDPVGWERLFSFTALPPQAGGAILALLAFAAFCVLALAVDRRSLLMSSLAFAIPATSRLTGLSEMSGILAAFMLIGAVLLALSSFWTRLRALILAGLPATIRAQLPRTAIANHGSRPVR
jgi:hypothetical protein